MKRHRVRRKKPNKTISVGRVNGRIVHGSSAAVENRKFNGRFLKQMEYFDEHHCLDLNTIKRKMDFLSSRRHLSKQER